MATTARESKNAEYQNCLLCYIDIIEHLFYN